jgi:S-adenosylmethionine hydrolase
MAGAAASTAAVGFEAAGVVSLLTDFGLQDSYVGAMHGVLLARARELRVVDLTHGIAPQDVAHAGWVLSNSFEYFPAGTVHVAVVDPGVGSARRILVATWRGHAFLAPDNGLLGWVLGPEAEVRELDESRWSLPQISKTFHGRDVFAPAAAALASGAPFSEAGVLVEDWCRLEVPHTQRLADGGLETAVLFADHFGNLITPLERGELEPGESWCVEVAGRRLPLVSTYADTDPGGVVALFGSSQTLEISVRDGSAARELGLAAGARVHVRRVQD